MGIVHGVEIGQSCIEQLVQIKIGGVRRRDHPRLLPAFVR